MSDEMSAGMDISSVLKKISDSRGKITLDDFSNDFWNAY